MVMRDARSGSTRRVGRCHKVSWISLHRCDVFIFIKYIFFCQLQVCIGPVVVVVCFFYRDAFIHRATVAIPSRGRMGEE